MTAAIIAAIVLAVVAGVIWAAVTVLTPHGAHAGQPGYPATHGTGPAGLPRQTWLDTTIDRTVARAAEIRTLLEVAKPEVARTRAVREAREAATGRPWAEDTGTFTAITGGPQ